MPDKNTPEFLGYLHSFRGLAILKIVFGHAVAAACIGAYGVFDVSKPILIISEVFYHDSTLYFAMISGLLFSKILKPRGYYKFYKSKLKHILLPYLFFTVVLTLIKINFSQILGLIFSITGVIIIITRSDFNKLINLNGCIFGTTIFLIPMLGSMNKSLLVFI